MNWYYAAQEEQKGPVDQAEFDRLVQTGVITHATLVWREGMADWSAYGTIAAAAGPAAAAPASSGVVCSECGQSFALDQMIRVGRGFVCATCKPLAIQKLREGVADNDSERIRQEHIKHEASIKSVGFLYFLGAAFLILGGVLSLAGGAATSLVVGLLFLCIGGVQFWVGLGLRKLRSWARIPTAILSGIGLLGFPLGTLINGYILYLVLSAKGRMIFSPEYQAVIAATPHIKYRTSIVVWILLILLLVLIGFAFVGVMFSRR